MEYSFPGQFDVLQYAELTGEFTRLDDETFYLAIVNFGFLRDCLSFPPATYSFLIIRDGRIALGRLITLLGVPAGDTCGRYA